MVGTEKPRWSPLNTNFFYLFVLVYRSQSIEEFGGDNDAVR